jgi:hypothetical protein
MHASVVGFVEASVSSITRAFFGQYATRRCSYQGVAATD